MPDQDGASFVPVEFENLSIERTAFANSHIRIAHADTPERVAIFFPVSPS